MRDNVTEPPKEFTELAGRIASSSVVFFRDAVDTWAKEAAGKDAILLAEFQAANRKAVTEFELAANYLKNDLLPNSVGQYAIGAENYRRSSSTTRWSISRSTGCWRSAKQLGEGLQGIRRNGEAHRRRQSPADVMKAISNEHPTEKKLLDFAKSTAESIRKFVVDKKNYRYPVRSSADDNADAALRPRRHVRVNGHAGAIRATG